MGKRGQSQLVRSLRPHARLVELTAFGEVEVGELRTNTSRAMCPLIRWATDSETPHRGAAHVLEGRPTYSQRLAMPLALCEATGG